MSRTPLLALVVLASAALAPDARAQHADEDRPSSLRAHGEEKQENANPLRGSTFLFEQSMTTQTAHLEPSPQQSYVPLYELWLSFRPRYNFDEHWSVRGRFDYTKELTNDQPTTYYREDVFGDVWTDLVYATKLDALWRGTKVDAGLRALWPTSKASQAAGIYVTPGVTAGASHRFDVNGEGAPWLNDFHVGLRMTYLHPFSAATTPTDYGAFAYERQDVDGFSFVSDQIQGTTLVNHTFWAILDTGVQITPKLSLSADMVLINQWHYAPTDVTLSEATGTIAVPRVGDTQFTQNTWFLASVNYAPFDELEIGLGYYNLANAIAPDGRLRTAFGSDNVWWSPDARVFLDITANLDALYDDAVGHGHATKRARQAARSGPVPNEPR